MITNKIEIGNENETYFVTKSDDRWYLNFSNNINKPLSTIFI